MEFLKINRDPVRLLAYGEHVFRNFSSTHIFSPKSGLSSLIPRESFIDKLKKSIVDLLFETNTLIYITNTKSSEKEKTDISENYKIAYCHYYPTNERKDSQGKSVSISDNPLAVTHLNSVIYQCLPEYDFCKTPVLYNCKYFENAVDDNEQRAIVILDITRRKVDDVGITSKVRCDPLRKKIKYTLRKFNPFVMMKVRTGGKKKTRRRKMRL